MMGFQHGVMPPVGAWAAFGRGDLFLKICTIWESMYAVSNSGEWGAPSARLKAALGRTRAWDGVKI